MHDQFGFPRRSETVAVGAGAQWKVFWVSQPPLSTGAVSSICPYVFPGRYFTTPTFGPTASTGTVRHGLSPILRFSGSLFGGATATSLQVSTNGGVTVLATIGTMSPGAGNAAWCSGFMTKLSPGLMVTQAGTVTNDATPASCVQSQFVYTGQDLSFIATGAANQTVMWVIEYLEMPL